MLKHAHCLTYEVMQIIVGYQILEFTAAHSEVGLAGRSRKKFDLFDHCEVFYVDVQLVEEEIEPNCHKYAGPDFESIDSEGVVLYEKFEAMGMA